MFAIAAALIFLLALFNVRIGTVDLVELGLLLVALDLAFDIGWGRLRRGGGRGPGRR